MVSHESNIHLFAQAVSKAHGFHLMLLLIAAERSNRIMNLKELYSAWLNQRPSMNTYISLINDFEKFRIISTYKSGKERIIQLNTSMLSHLFPIPEEIDRLDTVMPITSYLFDMNVLKL